MEYQYRSTLLMVILIVYITFAFGTFLCPSQLNSASFPILQHHYPYIFILFTGLRKEVDMHVSVWSLSNTALSLAHLPRSKTIDLKTLNELIIALVLNIYNNL